MNLAITNTLVSTKYFENVLKHLTQVRSHNQATRKTKSGRIKFLSNE